MDIVAPGSRVISASHENDWGYIARSGTSTASPAVAGAMAIWVGYERITADARLVRRRLFDNALPVINLAGFPAAALPASSHTSRQLVNTGIRQPPYIGAPPGGPVP